jgi:hypothetical protein
VQVALGIAMLAAMLAPVYGLAFGIQAIGNSPFWHDQVNECTIASQTLQNAAFNANPPAQHVVTTVNGAVAQDSYSYPVANPALANQQRQDGQARWATNHCGDNPLIGIAVWANPYPDWSRAAPATGITDRLVPAKN